jgi:hypothetical protein
MGYRLAPIEVNIAERGFAEFRICNERDEPIAIFGFADEDEAYIARALMIRGLRRPFLFSATNKLCGKRSILLIRLKLS